MKHYRTFDLIIELAHEEIADRYHWQTARNKLSFGLSTIIRGIVSILAGK